MIAVIYKDGEYINRIVADEGFAKAYCEENGYTYTVEPDPEPLPQPEPQYTADELLATLLGQKEEPT